MLLLLSLLQAPLTQSAAVTPETAGSPVPLVREEDKSWTVEADIGMTRLEGNTESTTGAANIVYSDFAGLQEWRLGAHWAATRQQDPVTADSTTTSRLFLYEGNYNLFFSEEKDLYSYAKAAHRTNVPYGLDHRTDVGVGLGYRFGLYQGETDDLDGSGEVEAGASWVADEKVGFDEDTSGVGRFAYLFDTPFSADLSLENSGEYLSNGDEIESYDHNLALRWTLNSTVYLSFSWNINWDGNPAPGFESTDRRYVLVLGASF